MMFIIDLGKISIILILITNLVQQNEGKLIDYRSWNSELLQINNHNYSNLFSKMFLNSNCVEIESKFSNNEAELNLVAGSLFALNVAVVLNNETGGELCRSILVLVGEKTSSELQAVLHHKADSRSTVAVMADSEEIYHWLLHRASANDIFDIFGFSDAFLIAEDSIYQLSSPKSVNRYFSVVTLQNLIPAGHQSSTRLPNFEKKLLTVITFDCPVNVFIKTVGNQSVMYDGLEYRLWREAARQLNFSYRIVVLQNDSDRWGQLGPDGRWRGGIIGAIMDDQSSIDVGFCGVWKIYPQSLYVDLTTSLIQERNRFLVRELQHELEWSWFAPFTEFQVTVWLCLGAVLALQLLVLYLAAQPKITKLCPSLQRRLKSLRRYSRVSSCLIELLGIHLQSSAPTWKRKSAFLLMVQFYSLIVTTSYTSHILNRLLLPQVGVRLDTIEQLDDADYYWGKPYPGAKDINYKAQHQPFMARRRLMSSTEINRMLREDDHFALLVATIMDTLIKVDVPVEVPLLRRQHFRAVPDDLQLYSIAFALRQNSPYTPVVNRLIARVARAGLLVKWVDELAARHRDKVLLVEKGGADGTEMHLFRALSLQNVKGAVALLLIGHLLAVSALILELTTCKNLFRPK